MSKSASKAAPPVVPSAVRGSAGFLLVNVFLLGAATLVLEILGARVMSPFFGSSVYTWSAVITVTLAVLAAGYRAGGAWADRSPDRRLFHRLVSLSGVLVLVIPFVKNAVLRPASGLGVGAGSLLSAAVLFGPALFTLSATGPLAIRLLTDRLESLGRGVGNVYAISTAGSVAGALLTGYALVPHFGVRAILIVLGLALILLGASGLFLSGRGGTGAAVVAATLAAAAPLLRGAPRPESNLLFSRSSFYGDVRVIDLSGDARVMLLDGVMQGAVSLRDGEPLADVLHFLELGPLLASSPRRALVIGLGAGSVPRAYALQGLTVDVAEIDPAVVRAAREQFGFVPSGKLSVADGRAFLRGAEGSYDVLLLDAFASERAPFHLFSREFFQEARERLAPGGVFMVNTVGNADHLGWVSVHKTLAAVFPVVRVFATPTPEGGIGNIVFAASTGPMHTPDLSAARAPARKALEDMLSQELPPPDGARLAGAVLFTDDFNPIEDVYRDVMVRWRRMVLSSARDVLLYETAAF